MINLSSLHWLGTRFAPSRVSGYANCKLLRQGLYTVHAAVLVAIAGIDTLHVDLTVVDLVERRLEIFPIASRASER